MPKQTIILEAEVNTGDSDQNLKKTKEGVDNVAKSVDKLKGINTQFDELNAKVEKGGLGFKDLSQAVKQYQDIALKSGKDSPVGQSAIQKATELQSVLGNLKKEIDNVGNNGKNLQTALQLGGTVIAGYTAFQGVTAMLGTENEDLLKVVSKLQGAMATLQAIEQVRAALEKESFIMLKLKNIQLQLQNKNLLQIAKSLLLNPYTAVLATVTALGAAIYYMVSQESRYDKAVRLSKEGTEALTKEIDKRTKIALRGVDDEINSLKAAGKETFEQELEKQEIIQRTSALRYKLLIRQRKTEELAFKAEIEEIRSKGGVFELMADKAIEKSKDKDSEIYKSRKALNEQIEAAEQENHDSTEALKNLVIEHDKERNDKAIKSNEDALKTKEDNRKHWAEVELNETKAEQEALLKAEQDYQSKLTEIELREQKLRDTLLAEELKANEENKATIDEEALARSEQIIGERESIKRAKDEAQLEYDRALMERGLISKKDFDALEIRSDLEKFDKRLELADRTAQAVSSISSSIFTVSNNLGKQDEKSKLERAKRQFKITKALNIGEVGIDTAKGISKAVAASPLTFGLPFSAFVGATGIAQIAAIASKQFDGGGGISSPPSSPSSSGGDSSSGTGSVPRTPDTTTNVESLLNRGQGRQQVREAIVIQSDIITGTQQELKQIEVRSSI